MKREKGGQRISQAFHKFLWGRDGRRESDGIFAAEFTRIFVIMNCRHILPFSPHLSPPPVNSFLAISPVRRQGRLWHFLLFLYCSDVRNGSLPSGEEYAEGLIYLCIGCISIILCCVQDWRIGRKRSQQSYMRNFQWECFLSMVGSRKTVEIRKLRILLAIYRTIYRKK